MRVALTLLLAVAGCHPVDDPLVPWRDLPGAAPTTLPVQTAPGHRIEPVLILLNKPQSVALDSAGNLYVGEDGLPDNPAAPPRILRVSPAGHVDVLCEQLTAPIQRLRWHDGKLLVWHDGKVTCVGPDGERCAPPQGYDAERDVTAFQIDADANPGPVVRRTSDGAVLLAPAPGGGARKPVSLAVSHDHKALYVADQGPAGTPDAGVVWRVTPEGVSCDGPPAGLSPPQQIGAPPGATRPTTQRR